MSKTLSVILIFTFVFAQAEMKCAAGKCGASMEEAIPKKPIPKPIVESKKEATQKSPTIKQLFNVRTVQIISQEKRKSQVNYGYIVPQDSSK
ncbi:MAG: hypothetical protein Q9M36_06145 [Sulfurovum sp.]|nr:hypothetical protein [Sulfurovum sp.]